MAEHNVILPQMGEGVHEGTITRWHKGLGARVVAGEVLFEVSTDKVDTEVPSPLSGIVARILVPERSVAKVGSAVAVVCDEAESGSETASGIVSPVAAVEPAIPAKSALPAPEFSPVSADGRAPVRKLSSPLVRKMAAAHGVDLNRVTGTGLGGRITRADLLPLLEPPSERPHAVAVQPGTGAGLGELLNSVAGFYNPNDIPAGMRTEVVPMSPMRKRIADHMVFSKHTSAHVTAVVEVDVQRIVDLRERHKNAFEKTYGLKLSFTPFFLSAAIAGLKAVPVVNSSVSGDTIIYKKDIHLAVAVALDWGLIVPVIRNAGDLNFVGLSRELQRLADAARSKKLMPEEVRDGTFSVSNYGVFGTLLGQPIISQPQVGIMGVGSLVKRPVVVNDAIAIRTMAYVVLSFDHRVIDGLDSGKFLSVVKDKLENWNESLLP